MLLALTDSKYSRPSDLYADIFTLLSSHYSSYSSTVKIKHPYQSLMLALYFFVLFPCASPCSRNYFNAMYLNFCPPDLSKIISVSILLPPSSTSCLTSYFSLLLPILNPKFFAGFLFPIYFFFLFPLVCASAISTFNSYCTVSSHSLNVFSVLQDSSPLLIYQQSSYSLQDPE